MLSWAPPLPLARRPLDLLANPRIDSWVHLGRDDDDESAGSCRQQNAEGSTLLPRPPRSQRNLANPVSTTIWALTWHVDSAMLVT